MTRRAPDLSALAKHAGYTNVSAAWREYVGPNAFGGPAVSMGAASPAQVRGFTARLQREGELRESGQA